jgi:required for meiotic nuclear division protein 1
LVPPSVYGVEAYSYASRFVLRDVAGFFPGGDTLGSTKTQLIVAWAADSRAYAFDFGALVFINVPDQLREQILQSFAAPLPREPHPPLHEDFLIEVRPGAQVGVEMAFDRVVVPELGPISMTVIAYVLAQSTAIDYYDEDVQAILDRIGTIATQVFQHGKPRGRQRDLVRFVGVAINSQVEIISSISLLDKPDITWEDEHADRLHDKLRHHLEIGERYKALEAKLLVIREALQALLDLSSHRRMLFIEVAILLLILVETAVGLLKLH